MRALRPRGAGGARGRARLPTRRGRRRGRGADVVLSVNSAAVAVEVAEASAPGSSPDALFADLNTAAPALKRAAAAAVEPQRRGVRRRRAAGARARDGASARPRSSSGPGAERFAADPRRARHAGDAGRAPRSGAAVGAQAGPQRLREGPGGRRSARRSTAAERLGCEDWLYADIERTLDRGRRPRCCAAWSRAAACTPARRVEEMAAAVALLEELGSRAARGRAPAEAWLRSLVRSEVARERRRGAPCPPRARASSCAERVDVHVHIAPDVVERRIDDVGLARRCEEVGLAGFVLKSHYTSTAERAAVVRGVVPGIAALGAIVLNRAIGGHQPAGGRDRRPRGRARGLDADHRLAQRARAPGRRSRRAPTCRCGRRLQAELRERGIAIEPVPARRRRRRDPARDRARCCA